MSTNHTNQPEDTQERLLGVIRRVLGPTGGSIQLRMDDELMAVGLDSMRAIDLLLALEGEFDLTFPDEMLTADTFRTPSALESALASLRGGG